MTGGVLVASSLAAGEVAASVVASVPERVNALGHHL